MGCVVGKFTIAKMAIGRRNNGLLHNSFTRKLVELLLFSHCLLLPVAFFEFRGEDQPEVFRGGFGRILQFSSPFWVWGMLRESNFHDLKVLRVPRVWPG